MRGLQLAAALLLISTVASVASAEWCSFNPLPVEVPAGKSITVALEPTELVDCDSKQAVITTAPESGKATTAGSVLVYIAPDADTDDVMRVTVRCTATPSRQCDALIGFIVTKTPAATTAAPANTTTASPTTTVPPLPTCSGQFPLSMEAPVGTVLRGKFAAPLEGCAISTFALGDNSASSGRIMLNFIGEYLIVASDTEGTQEYTVKVGCSSAPVCQFAARVLAYKPIDPPSTTRAIEVCPPIYYYRTPVSTTLSSSLADMAGQLSCPNGRTFSQVSSPTVGSLVFYSNGEFTFNPQTSNELYTSFNFQMSCGGIVSCSGVAHLLVSGTASGTLPTDATTAPTATTAPFVSDGKTTCAGTCNGGAWKVFPSTSTPSIDRARADGVAAGSISVGWEDSNLIIKGYSKIGNLAQEFLTFNPVADFAKMTAGPLSSFNTSALVNQGTDGLGVEVWTWTNMSAGEGHVGIRYNSGSSWYHKFGGIHIGCDTFSKGSRTYAPLLSPAAGWSIDINNCDATWTGRLSLPVLSALRTTDDRAVFRFLGNDMDGVIYSQTVQPASWLNPQAGIVTTVSPHPISVTWLGGIQVVKDASQRTFTLDAEFFHFTDTDGDAAFGINLMLFGFGGDSNSPDRHVTGFKWVSQRWDATPYKCPSCGTTLACQAPEDDSSEASFTGPFTNSGCGSKSFVTMSKGPSFNSSVCSNEGSEYDRLGFSAPKACGKYQNITIRGKAPGSRSKASDAGFNFAGVLQLQLLMKNGNKPIVQIILSQYVSRLSTSSALTGQMTVCRASTYFPVYDPIGTSLPDAPHALYEGKAGSMCVDNLDAYFGPHSWATFSVASNKAPTEVVIRSITVKGAATWQVPVFLAKFDASGAAVSVASGEGYWWKRTHPFLSFRLIAASKLAAGVTASFAFVPGTLGQDGPVTVAIQVQEVASGDLATFTKIIYVDKLLTDITRYGELTIREAELEEGASSGFVATGVLAFCAIGVIIIGLVVVGGDSNRKLPRWLPRGAFRKKKMAPKPKVISDPYSAALHL